MAFRRDFSRIENMRRTPSGGVIIPAAPTKTGVFVYTDSQGRTVKEYRSPEEVFKPESLATLRNAVVTEKHPTRLVTPDTWPIHTRGNVLNDSVRHDDVHVFADVAVEHGDTIKRIDSGALKELSCGYDCGIDPTPGKTPEGEDYDQRQIDIVYNHVAIGPEGWGRGGSSVCLRIDSNGDQCFDEVSVIGNTPLRRVPMIRFPSVKVLPGNRVRIDGVTYTLKTSSGRAMAKEALEAVKGRLTADAKDFRGTITARKDDAAPGDASVFDNLISALNDMLGMVHEAAAQAGVASQMAEDAAEPDGDETGENTDDGNAGGESDEENKVKGDTEDPKEKMDAMAARRADTISKARAFVPKLVTKVDGAIKSEVAIMREALAVGAKHVKTDGMTPGEVRGAFAMLRTSAAPKESTPVHPSLAALGGAASPQRTDGGADTGKKTVNDSRVSYGTHLANAWKSKKA